MKPRVLLAAHSLSPGNGGICRVARLMAKVLAEEHSSGRLSVRCEIFEDKKVVEEFPFPVRVAGGNRLRYVGNLHAATPRATHVLFDSEAMARARVRLPFLSRPWACWIHGVEVWEGAHPRRAQIAMKAACLWANSAYTRQRASIVWPDLRAARVCWLATEDDDSRARCSPDAEPPRVTIIGRVDASNYKGHDDLIAIWPAVCSVVPNAELQIVGTGSCLANLQAVVAASSVATNIVVRGFIPDSEIQEVWRGTTIFAMPSRGEGFGLVYVEAMRHAIPVIASTADAAQEINIDGVTGLSVPPGDRGALREAIVKLLLDRQMAARLGEKGQRRWREHFCFSRFRERWCVELRRFLTPYAN